MQTFNSDNYDFEDNYGDEFDIQELQNDFSATVRTKRHSKISKVRILTFVSVLILILGLFFLYFFTQNSLGKNLIGQAQDLKEDISQQINKNILTNDSGTDRKSETQPEVIKSSRPSSPDNQPKEILKTVIDVDSLVSSDFTTPQVLEIKEITKSVSANLSLKDLKPKQKIKININYANNSGRLYEQGSLFIKISEGLELVPGSISETFMGQESQAVSDATYNAEKNLLMYGPNSKDKFQAPVQNLEKGSLSFVLEIENPEVQNWAIGSFLKDQAKNENSKPGFVFIQRSE